MSFRRHFFDLDADHLYFDCAASPPPLACVVQAAVEFMRSYGSIHRGAGVFSKRSTDAYEQARSTVGHWLGATADDAVAFCGNTTDALNRFAAAWPWQLDDEVLTLDNEHSSNRLPWMARAKVRVLATDGNHRVDVAALDAALRQFPRIRFVALAAGHNLTGALLDLAPIHECVRSHGRHLVVDGSQWAAHARPSLAHCDVLAFSGHKMYAPFGAGVLAARKELLCPVGLAPSGGGNITLVNSLGDVYYKEPPHNHEPGTPNGVGAVALAAAADFLHQHEAEVAEHNRELVAALLDEFPPAEQLFSTTPGASSPVLLYRPQRTSLETLVSRLDGNKVSFRVGTFCSYSLFEKVSGVRALDANVPPQWVGVRFSAGLCTDVADVRKLASLLHAADC